MCLHVILLIYKTEKANFYYSKISTLKSFLFCYFFCVSVHKIRFFTLITLNFHFRYQVFNDALLKHDFLIAYLAIITKTYCSRDMNNSKMYNVKRLTSHESALHILLRRSLKNFNFLRTKLLYYLIFIFYICLVHVKQLPENDLRKIETRRIFAEISM